MPQLVHTLNGVASEPIIYDENKSSLPITTMQDEVKFIYSFNTLGYIEFDVLCNLNNLKEKLSFSTNLLCLSKNTFQVIGKYNCKGEYMVHRVYILSNIKSPFVSKQYDQLEGRTNANPIMSSVSCSSIFVLKQYDKFQGSKLDDVKNFND